MARSSKIALPAIARLIASLFAHLFVLGQVWGVKDELVKHPDEDWPTAGAEPVWLFLTRIVSGRQTATGFRLGAGESGARRR